MARFKVALHRRIWDNCNVPGPNPFLAPIPAPGKTHRMLVREWELDARDEAEVRRLLKEAQETGVGAVQGFSLRSIKRVTTQRLSGNND